MLALKELLDTGVIRAAVRTGTAVAAAAGRAGRADI